MFGKRFHLFTVFGFAINIDVSWFFLAIVVAWSLADGVFPVWYPGLNATAYIWMGVIGSLGLFVSIVLHELAHSLVARQHGVVMRGITLFIFGGVAEMTAEPPSPKAEFQVAIAGPLASVAVAVISYFVASTGDGLQWPPTVVGVFKYLALINTILVLFNMIPAFPLDGGRVLRAILWNSRKNLTSATRTTSRIGVAFAFLLIGLGVIRVVWWRDVIGGIWSFLVGMFLRNAANMSYQQVLVRHSLEGEPVRRFMQADPVTVPGNISIQTLVEDYVYRYHFKMFPVVENANLIGCIMTRQIKDLPREEWSQTTVRDIAQPLTSDNSIDINTDVIQALAKMNRSRITRLMVLENNRLVGLITIKDLLQYLSVKMELEGEGR